MPSSLTRYFVFLEICDADICELLNGLRSIFNSRKFSTGIHVTLRGPYLRPVSDDDMDDWFNRIKASAILIANVGKFENDQECVVYLGVSSANESKNLSVITRKFHYPKNRFDFNPHITLYSGRDKVLAEKIFNFLRKEKIELACHEFMLSAYASNPQAELFAEPRPSIKGEISSLISLRKIKHGILDRAQSLVELHSSQ